MTEAYIKGRNVLVLKDDLEKKLMKIILERQLEICAEDKKKKENKKYKYCKIVIKSWLKQIKEE